MIHLLQRLLLLFRRCHSLLQGHLHDAGAHRPSQAAVEGVSFHPGALASAAAAAEGVHGVAQGRWVQVEGSVLRCSVASLTEVSRLRCRVAEVTDPQKKTMAVDFLLEVVCPVWVAQSIRPLSLKKTDAFANEHQCYGATELIRKD